ncbi:MAG: Rieske 2Fe-2S domain-containing protein [Acidobacteria bacterium]|nr:Rieske 2Fe-2S domain-containing protein [Acidobacteriota bacterium]MBI3663228.1 Rieske 2Fe-2S domain-containing protein [Acidobacteriota bacterium]
MAEPNESKPVESKAAPAPADAAAKKPEAKSTSETNGSDVSVARRRLIWACIWGYLGVNLLMVLRFFFPRALFEPKTVFSIGYPSDFNIGVDTKFQKDYRIWVVRSPGRLFVIYARCTHLGCTPDWKESESKFKCPCHGSGYDSEGVNFEGPAPRPMDRAQVQIDAQGQIIVDTGKLFVKDPTVGRDEFEGEGSFLIV